MLDPKVLQNGQDQHEEFKASRGGKLVQYDYRRINGELISCVGKTLEDCRKITVKKLVFNGADMAEIRHYLFKTTSEPFEYMQDVPCGQVDAQAAYNAGACKNCPRNALCCFCVQEPYYDVVYNCRGEKLSSYSVGD